MFPPGLIALLLVASTPTAKAGGESDAGFAGRGLGMELGGSGALQYSSGSNSGSYPMFLQWEVLLRFRIGQFFSIGASYESLSGEIGGPGDAQRFYQRKQIAADVQWRFWGVQGVVRPWLGLGMAWGSIHEEMAYTSYPSIDAHVWEYFRFGAGVDLVPVRWIAFGPWARVGLATTPSATSPGQSGLQTFLFGVRALVAFP